MFFTTMGFSQLPHKSELITASKKATSIDTFYIPAPFGPIKHSIVYYLDTTQVFDSVLIENIEKEIMKLNSITFDSTNRIEPVDISKDSLNEFKLIYYKEYSLDDPYPWAGKLVYNRHVLVKLKKIRTRQ